MLCNTMRCLYWDPSTERRNLLSVQFWFCVRDNHKLPWCLFNMGDYNRGPGDPGRWWPLGVDQTRRFTALSPTSDNNLHRKIPFFTGIDMCAYVCLILDSYILRCQVGFDVTPVSCDRSWSFFRFFFFGWLQCVSGAFALNGHNGALHFCKVIFEINGPHIFHEGCNLSLEFFLCTSPPLFALYNVTPVTQGLHC